MDKLIDARFERIEKALSALIDSVAKYNPSSTQARELEAADQALSQGLEQVQEHQRNHHRILLLRQESTFLDTQIRETLTSLHTTRQDVKTTQATTFPTAPNYPFSYTDLLSYARRISKTTLPPPGLVQQGAVLQGAETQPTPLTNGGAQTPAGTQPPTPLASEPPTQSTNTSLPDMLTVHLNPLSGQVFVPWPTEDKVRVGGLASNQILAEQGIDPRGYDPVEEEERRRREEEERRAAEERERFAREETERRMREERERARIEREKARESNQEAWRRGSVAGPQSATAAPGEKKQFQFTSIDDMDDDD